MEEQEKPTGFVHGWVKAEIEANPECPIIKAIAEHTTAEQLDEAKLLVVLKDMARQQPEKDT